MVSEDVWLVSFQFYNDPVSGYVFRMKDALHYVETGEPGRLAFKPKDKSDNDEDLEEDNDCEPAIVERQKVAVNGTTDETERQSAEQVSNLSRITKGEEMLTSASTGEQTSFSFSRLWVCKAEADDVELVPALLSELYPGAKRLMLLCEIVRKKWKTILQGQSEPVTKNLSLLELEFNWQIVLGKYNWFLSSSVWECWRTWWRRHFCSYA